MQWLILDQTLAPCVIWGASSALKYHLQVTRHESGATTGITSLPIRKEISLVKYVIYTGVTHQVCTAMLACVNHLFVSMRNVLILNSSMPGMFARRGT
jgi:hypothetical protein